MCGIAGILSLDGQAPDRADLRTMSAALLHRGPDDEGEHVEGPCALAHRRLAIVDLTEGGHQPMVAGGGRYALVYNGEVYNHVELREALERRGHQFRSTSDTEVVLKALIEWGDDAVERFNGMWAFALWDREEQRLLLSRDRLGIKPLYLYVSGRRLVFASEVKAIAAIAPELTLDLQSVGRLLRSDASLFADRTFFTEVKPLEAGTLTSFVGSRRRDRRFWRLPPPSDADESLPASTRAVRELRELLKDAVRLRFRSDVAVGTCLSGGLDSSSIVAVASRDLGRTPTCFSAVYAVPGFDERPFVERMTQAFALQTELIEPDGRDLPDTLEALTVAQDGPVAGPGPYTQWRVMKRAAGHVGVLLDGQGADELFGGYHHYLALRWWAAVRRAAGTPNDLRRLPELHRALTRRFGRAPSRYLLGLAARRAWWRHVAPSLRHHVLPHLPPTMSRSASLDRLAMPSLLGPAFGGHLAEAPQARDGADPLDATLRLQTERQGLPQLLHYEDRSSMAHSIEARVPFLDHRVVELAFRLPSAFKIDETGTTKAILRRAMSDALPAAVRDRQDKLGYPTPAGGWLRTHDAWLRELLLGRRATGRRLMRPGAVTSLVDDHLAGRHDHTARLTQLATLEIFLRRFFDEPFRPAPPAPR